MEPSQPHSGLVAPSSPQGHSQPPAIPARSPRRPKPSPLHLLSVPNPAKDLLSDQDDLYTSLMALAVSFDAGASSTGADKLEVQGQDLLKEQSTPLTKRQHALHELLSSERAYASDLALIRQVHIPLALGQQIPHSLPISPPSSSGSSSRTVSTVSSSSLPSLDHSSNPSPDAALSGPAPMTPEDVKMIFNNITEIAVFSDLFCLALQEALGDLLQGGKGDDHVGALFLSIIPELEKPYKHYITRHPTSLTHLSSLPQTSALQSYLSHTQTIASSLSHAWDLSSLLIKPVQRLLKYPLLLTAIIDETPDSHTDKLNLKEARKQLEEVARNVNEGRRRAEVVRDVLASKKKPPGPGVGVTASVNLTKMKSLRVTSTSSVGGGGSLSAAINQIGAGANGPSGLDDQTNEEAMLVARLESEFKTIEEFSQRFAKHIVEWARSTSTVILSLRTWALGFSKVIGLTPDQGSEAFDAFLIVIEKQLMPLCVELEAVINERVLKELAHLLMTMTQPLKLLASMNEQEPYHLHLMNMTVTPKNRPPPSLLAASTNYLALRGQLAAELPTYITLFHRGLHIFIHRLSAIQTEFYAKVREQWLALWEMLRLEEELNIGHEETINVWRTRWNEVDDMLCGMPVVNDPRKVYQDLRALVYERREREREREFREREVDPEADAEYYTLHHLQTFARYQSNMPDTHTRNPNYDIDRIPIHTSHSHYVTPSSPNPKFSPSDQPPATPNSFTSSTSGITDRRESRDNYHRDNYPSHHHHRSHSHSRDQNQYQQQQHYPRERGNTDRDRTRERERERERERDKEREREREFREREREFREKEQRKKSSAQAANAVTLMGALEPPLLISPTKPKQDSPVSSSGGDGSGRPRGNSNSGSRPAGSFMNSVGMGSAFGVSGGLVGGIPAASTTSTGGTSGKKHVTKKSSNDSLVSKATVRSPQYHQHHHGAGPGSHSPRQPATTAAVAPRQPVVQPQPHRRRTTGGLEPAPDDLRDYEVIMTKEQERMQESEFDGYAAAQQKHYQQQQRNSSSGQSGGGNHPYQHHPGLPRTKSMPLPYHPQSHGHRPSAAGSSSGNGGERKRGAREWSDYVDDLEDDELFYGGAELGYHEHRPTRPRERKDAVTSSPAKEKLKRHNQSQSQTRKDKDEKRNSSSSRKRSSSIKSITSFFTRDGNTNVDTSILSTTATTPALTHASSSVTTTDHTPSPRDSWALKPAKYICVVIHPCKPPTTGPNSSPLSYFSFPFFTLKEGELYDVLQEAGHPSLHPNLPLIVDEGEDCLLLCRSVMGSGGAEVMRVGWALASFLKPCNDLKVEGQR